MKPKHIALVAALLVIAAPVTQHTTGVAHAKTAAIHAGIKMGPPPKVYGAAKLRKKFGGQTITFVGDSNVGEGHIFDKKLVAFFSKKTGIHVNLVPQPALSDASYQQKARAFSSHSSSIDVMMLDVVWPGAFAPYLVNLKPFFGKTTKKFYQSVVQNDTIHGKMVAAPYFGDFGILYYRTDLLHKYGYSSPPTTWTQLTAMAKKIVPKEQKKNSNFTGFVFQGSAYEGLTCDSLEWLASSGGGTFFKGKKSNVDNPKAVKMMQLVQSWVGTISPQGVTNYTEESARIPFDNGNALFMRNWPYAYAISADPKQSKIAGKFGVAPLPNMPGNPHVGTVGGWQLGVNKYSKHIGASVAFLKYMTGAGVSHYRAVFGGYVPLVVSVANQQKVIKAQPYLSKLKNVIRVTRPSRFLGGKYPQGSQYIYQDMNQILRGGNVSSTLSTLQSQLNRLVG